MEKNTKKTQQNNIATHKIRMVMRSTKPKKIEQHIRSSELLSRKIIEIYNNYMMTSKQDCLYHTPRCCDIKRIRPMPVYKIITVNNDKTTPNASLNNVYCSPKIKDPGQVVGLYSNSYKPITNKSASDKVYQLLAHDRWYSRILPPLKLVSMIQLKYC